MKKILAIISLALVFVMLFVSCDLSEKDDGDRDGDNKDDNKDGETESGGDQGGETEQYTAGLLFTELDDGTLAVSRGTATAAEHIVIPSTYNGKTVTQIAVEGFNESVLSETESNVIKTVTLPSTITKIGRSAFGYCIKLTSINIPSGVTEIEKMAFANCQSLESIVLPNGIKEIGEMTFMWCMSLETVDVPSAVETVGNRAFYGCDKLKSVTLPSELLAIGERVFMGCTALEKINFRGTEAQWNGITKGKFWDLQAASYTVVYDYAD